MDNDESNFFAAPPSEAPIILGSDLPAYDNEIVAEEPTYDLSAQEENARYVGEVVQEASPMQKWNDQWQETLKVRKDEENARKAQLVEQARVDLEQFQRDRAAKRETKMAKNRQDEQAKLEAIEADLENDNSWQKVCKMVELSHDSKDKAMDVKRMRDIMITLKNEPAKAETLSN